MEGRVDLGDGGSDILAGAQSLDLLAQFVELGLAGHLVEAGAEFGGHAAHLGGELADLAHQHRQVLGPDHDQRDGADQQHLERALL
jgi:hypothetical protein